MATRIRYGSTGHELEYVINDDRYDLMGEWFPGNTDALIKALLPEGWYSMNRGSRIEIQPPRDDRYRDSTYPIVLHAVETVIGEVKSFQVIDEDYNNHDILTELKG